MPKFSKIKGYNMPASSTLTIKPSNTRDQIVLTNMNMSGAAVTVVSTNGTDDFSLAVLSTSGTLDGIMPQYINSDRYLKITNSNAIAKLDLAGYYEEMELRKPQNEYITSTT